LDPSGWSAVTELLKARFQSSIEAFYLLKYDRSAFHELHVAGVEAPYYRSFPQHFFAPDNPFARSAPLHRPGVIRTDAMVQEFFRDPEVVRRSRYFNEWMRPQDLAHTLGTTLTAEDDGVANLSLLRSADIGPFDRREVASFGRLAVHLRRAVRVARRLETLRARERASLEALEALPHGALFLDLHGRPLHGNRTAESILRRGDVLTLNGGRLVAAVARDQARLDGLLQHLAQGPDATAAPPGLALGGEPGALHVIAVRLSDQPGRFADGGPCLFLLLIDPAAHGPREIDGWRRRHGLTPAETRLAEALVAGESLRGAAERLGISYETARWYLKVVFQKTDTRRQSELVARLLSRPDLPLA
jgi:DNA-binding CsgD family transcriptional regulator